MFYFTIKIVTGQSIESIDSCYDTSCEWRNLLPWWEDNESCLFWKEGVILLDDEKVIPYLVNSSWNLKVLHKKSEYQIAEFLDYKILRKWRLYLDLSIDFERHETIAQRWPLPDETEYFKKVPIQIKDNQKCNTFHTGPSIQNKWPRRLEDGLHVMDCDSKFRSLWRKKYNRCKGKKDKLILLVNATMTQDALRKINWEMRKPMRLWKQISEGSQLTVNDFVSWELVLIFERSIERKISLSTYIGNWDIDNRKLIFHLDHYGYETYDKNNHKKK